MAAAIKIKGAKGGEKSSSSIPLPQGGRSIGSEGPAVPSGSITMSMLQPTGEIEAKAAPSDSTAVTWEEHKSASLAKTARELVRDLEAMTASSIARAQGVDNTTEAARAQERAGAIELAKAREYVMALANETTRVFEISRALTTEIYMSFESAKNLTLESIRHLQFGRVQALQSARAMEIAIAKETNKVQLITMAQKLARDLGNAKAQEAVLAHQLADTSEFSGAVKFASTQAGGNSSERSKELDYRENSSRKRTSSRELSAYAPPFYPKVRYESPSGRDAQVRRSLSGRPETRIRREEPQV